MRKLSLSRFFSTDEGAIAPLYALAMFALVGAAGIGFDYARLVSLDSELQNAADQAALAAATQLDREPGAASRADSAATGGLVSNDTLLANDGGARAVAVPSVRFYATRAAAEADTNGTGGFDEADAVADPALDATAAFVRVAVEMRTANYALTPIVGAISGTIDAKAVAGMGSALCRSPPVMICNPNEPVGNTDPAFDFDADSRAGNGLLLALGGGGGGDSWAPGNFGYLDTGGSGGAGGVREALGWISPSGNCVSQNGDDTVVDTEPGVMTSVTQALNTRFDIYETNVSCMTGGACPASINSVKDVMHHTPFSHNNRCKLGNASQNWDEPASGKYNPTSATAAYVPTPTAMGHPRDMCHAAPLAAADSCENSEIGNGLWDRDAYFRSHYQRTSVGTLGEAIGTRWTAANWWTNLSTGLNPVDASSAATVTRYDVYLWEIAHKEDIIDGVGILDPYLSADGTQKSFGTPQCGNLDGRTYGSGTLPSDTVADRRRISVAVVNCYQQDVNGHSEDLEVRRWMDVFLVQPSHDRSGTGRNTRKAEIYVEIIRETSAGSSGETAGQVVRRDVPFLIR